MREAWSVWAELSRSLSGPWGAVSCVTGRVHCVVDSQRVLMSVVFSFPMVLGLNLPCRMPQEPLHLPCSSRGTPPLLGTLPAKVWDSGTFKEGSRWTYSWSSRFGAISSLSV